MLWKHSIGRLAGIVALVLSGAALAASPGSLPYSARGQEPGWHLAITGQAVTLEIAAGERFQATTPRPRRTGQRTRYDVVLGGRPSRITIERRLCHDTMSGMPHPDRVSIFGLGPVLRGCGGLPRTLLGTNEWVVAQIAGTPVIAKAGATLQFLDDGALVGKASCNRFRSSFMLTGEGLTFGAAATTMMACPPDIMQQEQSLLRQLEGVTGFDIRADGALILKGKDGTALVARRR
ncbi:META domain-containing protein [Bosea sp. 124]|uniref:META domain-containing protein n=1 Tax=Bosea sp. 124 TaxID=2135642 RepID=UPI000D46CFF6|nr:META domain-containing protein [Bosea sp. 124]PTM40164.1 heat shock protein HslJ [Bosea sp. 124]